MTKTKDPLFEINILRKKIPSTIEDEYPSYNSKNKIDFERLYYKEVRENYKDIPLTMIKLILMVKKLDLEYYGLNEKSEDNGIIENQIVQTLLNGNQDEQIWKCISVGANIIMDELLPGNSEEKSNEFRRIINEAVGDYYEQDKIFPSEYDSIEFVASKKYPQGESLLTQEDRIEFKGSISRFYKALEKRPIKPLI